VNPNDYTSDMKGAELDLDPTTKETFENQVGRTIYKGYWLDDAPGAGAIGVSGYPFGIFFQADVHVKEATSVKKTWGYWVLVKMQGGSPVVGGRTWDDEPHPVFDPSKKLMNDSKDQWHGPTPLDLRPNQPPSGRSGGYYRVL